VWGGQLGTGIAWEIIKLWFAGIEVVGLVVTALATKPANMTEKIDEWTRSFMIWLPLGGDISFGCGSVVSTSV
jgi:hypothetical protein